MRTTRPATSPATSTLRAAAMAVFAFVLAGCASSPKAPTVSGGRVVAAPTSERDGADARPPANLAQVPDAEPRIETVRPGGANKPYQALGRDYVPLTGDPAFAERGLASWYGRKFQGRRTASGEPYDMYAMTAAHPTLPIPSYARVRNPANGREVVVRINDRGPFHSGRIVDLSYTAALKLDVLRGVAPVELERITYDDVRTGAWRRSGGDTRVAATKPVSAPGMVPPPLQTSPWPVASVGTAVASTASAGSVDSTGDSSPALVSTSMPPLSTSTAPATPTSPPDVADAAPLPQPGTGFYVQLGAFRGRDGAEVFQRRVLADADWLSPVLSVFGDDAFYRLQAGPYANRAEAMHAADRMRADLQLVPLIVERR